MSTYTVGFKNRMIERMAGPDAVSATALSKECGVSQGTLSRWLRESAATLGGMSKKTKSGSEGGKSPRRWTAQEKVRVVMEASALSEEELGAFLRREGLHTAQLEEWRATLTEAATSALSGTSSKKKSKSPEAKRVRELEKELRRKDKALAEVTALLALKKKLEALWGDEDDDTNARSET